MYAFPLWKLKISGKIENFKMKFKGSGIKIL